MKIFRNGKIQELPKDDPLYFLITKARARAQKIIRDKDKEGGEEM